MLTLIAALAMTQSAVDHGVLIGLRDLKGGYRTVLVSQRGVAFVSKEHKGELLRPMKMSVHAFRTEEQGLLYQGNHQAVPGTFRIAWAGGTGIGLEFDASRPGERPFSRKYRRVLGNENFRKFSDALDVHEKSAFADAAAEARKKASSAIASMLPLSPDEEDWGFVRRDGRWQFVGAFTARDARLEFFMDDPPVMNPPFDNGEVTWRSAIGKHAEATDVVSSRDTTFAVVVTKDYLYVHEATRTGLGREVRRIPAKDEEVVCFYWGASGPLEVWLEYIKG